MLWIWCHCLTPAMAQVSYQPLPANLNESFRRNPQQVTFTRTAPQFLTPVLPTPYVLDTEDQITVDLQSAKVSQTHGLAVNEQGTIFIPRLGTFEVRGLTQTEVSQRVSQRARQRFGAGDLNVSVFLRQPRAMQVLVSGQVMRPGYYRVPQGTHVLEALRAAGGVLDTGSVMALRWVQKNRTESVNLWRFLNLGQSTDNPALQSGDQIHVPVMPRRVLALGAFQQPGIYEVPRSSVPVSTVVEYAGGLLPNATQLLRWPALLTRTEPASAEPVVTTDLLQSEDALYAPLRQADTVSATVLVQGMVRQPGTRPWQAGMRLLDVLELAGGAQANADLSQVQLSRLNATTQRREQQKVDLNSYLQGQGDEADNPLLAAGDVITFPENFFNIRNISEFTTLLLSTLGIVSVVINMSGGAP